MENGYIKAEKLTLAYKNHEPIIEYADFEIQEGDFVFITGVSGSGKTTLIKSFYGAMKPIYGNLEINGYLMQHMKKNEIYDLRQEIGIVFQDYKLIADMNIVDNVALPLIIQEKPVMEAREHAKKLLKHVNLLHRIYSYPDEVSGGEQQRTSVARALVTSPKMILADEPTGNLDDYSSSVVFDLLIAANNVGKTVIVVTHHPIPKDFKIGYKKFIIKDKRLIEE